MTNAKTLLLQLGGSVLVIFGIYCVVEQYRDALGPEEWQLSSERGIPMCNRGNLRSGRG